MLNNDWIMLHRPHPAGNHSAPDTPSVHSAGLVASATGCASAGLAWGLWLRPGRLRLRGFLDSNLLLHRLTRNEFLLGLGEFKRLALEFWAVPPAAVILAWADLLYQPA